MEIQSRALIAVAPDSFKESLSAEEACEWMARGIRKSIPNAKILQIPLADGGEGTLDALCSQSGKILSSRVQNPLKRVISAKWGLIHGGRTAVIEMAQASGLGLVPLKQRNPMITSSFGTGQQILKALDHGCREIILTLGGVATNDGGAGMATALGYRFLDKDGKSIGEGAQALKKLAKIDASRIHPKIKKTKFTIACDVTNPLCGPRGSARIYGPQKGATPEMVREIEKNLRNLARVIRRDLRINILSIAGGGAAGGAGAGTVAFFGAKIMRGIEVVFKASDFEKKIRKAGLILTGEGKIDRQTCFGKTISGVAESAKKRGIPVLAFCGTKGSGWESVLRLGVKGVFSLTETGISSRLAMKRAGPLLQKQVQEAMQTAIIMQDCSPC